MGNEATGIGTLNVEDDGKGDGTVVWVHAFPLDSRMWSAQVEGLPGWRHLRPDLPGFGRSTPTVDVLAMDQTADAVVELLEMRGLERAVFAGCSMGGYVLLALCSRHLARVRGLVLIDTKAEADGPEAKANREAFAKKVLAEGPGAARDALLPKLLARPEGPAADRVARMILEATPQGIAAAQRGMAARADSTGLLPRIAAPTLVLVGEKDALTPPELSEKMAAAIPGARKIVIPGSGHLPPIEAPQPTTAAIREFLASLR
mgnify:CR=1 FL=1